MIRILSTVKKCILEKRSQSHFSVSSTVAAVFRGLTEKVLEGKAWASLGKTDGSELGKRVRAVNSSIMSSQSS